MMKKKSCKFTPRSWIILEIAFLFLAACNTEYPESCPSYNLDFDLSKAETYPIDDSLPFQFPLDEYEPGSSNYKSSFVMRGRSSLSEPYKYHAAEDSYDPPGTPAYAMADGRPIFHDSPRLLPMSARHYPSRQSLHVSWESPLWLVVETRP